MSTVNAEAVEAMKSVPHYTDVAALKAKGMKTASEMAQAVGMDAATIRQYVQRGILKVDAFVPAPDKHHHQYMFSQETYDAFVSRCVVGDYNGEVLLSPGKVAKILDVTPSAINYYVRIGKLSPDVVLPSEIDGRISEKRFTIRTIRDFVDGYNCRRKEEWQELIREYILKEASEPKPVKRKRGRPRNG